MKQFTLSHMYIRKKIIFAKQNGRPFYGLRFPFDDLLFPKPQTKNGLLFSFVFFFLEFDQYLQLFFLITCLDRYQYTTFSKQYFLYQFIEIINCHIRVCIYMIICIHSNFSVRLNLTIVNIIVYNPYLIRCQDELTAR